jgi:hypothetical protein
MLKIIRNNNLKLFIRNISISPKNPFINQKEEEEELYKDISNIDDKLHSNEEDQELDRLDQISKKHSDVN